MRIVLQNNLIKADDLLKISDTCRYNGVDVQFVEVIPFVDDVPEFTYNKNNMYYGSTTLMYNIHNLLREPKGLFYDPKRFNMSKYLHHWGERMLNSSARLMRVWIFLEEWKNHKWDEHFGEYSTLFVRPNGDGKEFDGQVGTYEEIKEMLKRHLEYGSRMTMDSMILVGPAYNIFKEWRLYIVGGEIVTASRYRKDFKLSKSSEDIPEDMLEFARECIDTWKPHENFALDICNTHDGEYYIVEAGCLNSVGFYDCDIDKLFTSIIRWMKK